MSRRDEDGSATVYGIAFIAVIALVCVVAVAVAGIVLAHRRAESAADLAALAAATGYQQGADPCSQARRVALANQAQVTSCSLAGPVATVEVSTVAVAGVELRMPARSRAGPEGLR